MTAPNHELFVKVLAQIEREPQAWDQQQFAHKRDCGTAYCFAGWACVLDGWQFYIDTHPNSGVIGLVVERGEESECASDVAEDLLGIGGWGDDDHPHLFDSGNTLADLYRLSADLLGVDEQVLRDKVQAEVAA